jgi:hypothetical protein
VTAPDAKEATVPALRALIDGIVLPPPAKSGQGVEIEVQRKLAAIIGLATGWLIAEDCVFVMERVKGFRSMIWPH